MKITPRILTIPTIALAVMTAGLTLGALSNDGVEPPTPTILTVTDTQCEEDQPCWDCETMGNQQCGLPDSMQPAAWQTWDDLQGWSRLAVDPTRGVEVQAVAYAVTQPTKETDRVALRGADDRWYIFSATYTD